MNWLPLRKNNIPLIDLQIEKAISIHQEIQQSIMEGDILSIQKMSDFQLSIKKRIQEIDQFYNKNCFDERVRFLQAARMKLSRIVHQNILNEKQLNVGLPWKNTNDIAGSRKSNSSQKKSVTPRKKALKNEKNNNQALTLNNQRPQRSPISQSNNDYQENQDEGKVKNKKVQLTLEIPESEFNNHITFSGGKSAVNYPKRQSNQKLIKSRRKMEVIPTKNRSQAITNQHKINKSPIDKADRKTQEIFRENSTKIKISQAVGGGGSSSRVKGVNNSSRTRTVTQGNNSGGNSIKMLNDLIFTIKMTKSEYEDFIEIKKQLNQR